MVIQNKITLQNMGMELFGRPMTCILYEKNIHHACHNSMTSIHKANGDSKPIFELGLAMTLV